MGSIQVYDAKQQKWVPYVPDYDKWSQHFKDLSEGYVQPDHMGRYAVGSGRRNRNLKEMETQLAQQQERPEGESGHTLAQALEIAKFLFWRPSWTPC